MSINTNISVYPPQFNPTPGSIGQSPVINSANGAPPVAPAPASAVNQSPATTQAAPPPAPASNNTNNGHTVNKVV